MAIDFSYRGEQTELVDLDKLEKVLRKYLPEATVNRNGFVYVLFGDLSCIAFRANGEVAWTILERTPDDPNGGIANRCVPNKPQEPGKERFLTYPNLKDFVLDFMANARHILG